MKVFPVEIVLETGANRFGLVGVLLPVGLPVKSWRDPVLATLLNGRENVIVSAFAAVFEIYSFLSLITEFL